MEKVFTEKQGKMICPKVLLVDDEQPFAEVMTRRLAAIGFDVETAFSGQEALNRLQARSDLDVVVLDFKMPGMDGLAALQEIKEEHPLVEVILLTGHATVASAVDGMKHGAFDYLMKPCELGELVKKIYAAAAVRTGHESRILDLRMKPFITERDRKRRISEIKSSASKGERKP